MANCDGHNRPRLPLDTLLISAAQGPLRRFVLSTVKLALGLARRPLTTARRIGGLCAETARVVVGASDLASALGDRRFADPAWTENPVLRRVLQAYLAGARTAEQLVSDASLDWRDDQRMRFLLENLVESVSPSNVPLLNPASAKELINFGG